MADNNVYEMYRLAEGLRDPAKRYAPDKDNGPKLHKDKKKDKPKPEPKDQNITIKRTLVRNADGTVGVQFVDVDTGRVITGDPFGPRKDITSAGDFDDVFGKKKKIKTDKSDEAPTGSQEIEGYRISGYDDKGNPKYVPIGGGAVTAQERPPSESNRPTGFTDVPAKTSGKTPSDFESPEEQGDQAGFFNANGSNDPSLDKDYQIDGKFAPADVPERDFQSEVASSKKEDAHFANMDEGDFTTIDGNNSHPMEGKNLNDAKSLASDRNWDDATIDKAARTLAGELAGNVDLNTPEGIQEARSILSTIENRDIANGPSKSAIDAMTAKSQYSTWNDEKAANVANTNYNLRADEFNKVVKDYIEDPNSNLGFTSYHAPYVNPAWSDDMQNVEEIGSHKFGTLPEYTSKMAKYSTPMTDEQKNSIATDIVNQNFQQSFAAPVGDYIAQNTPQIDTTGVQVQNTDMASGLQAQRDYISPSLSSNSSFAQGINAQRDYNGFDFANPQQITEDSVPDLNTNGPLQSSTDQINNQISMDNGFAIQQGNQIAGMPPSIPTETQVASRSITGIEDGFVTAPDTSQFSSTGLADRVGVAPNMDQSRFGNNPEITSLSDDKGMGFGDYVSVAPSNQISNQNAAVQTDRINGLYDNENVGMLNAANDIANSAPTVAGISNAVESQGFASDPTSAGSGPDAASADTGVSSGAMGGFADATHDTDPAGSSTGGSMGTAPGSDGLSGTDADSEDGGSDGFL